jgi:SAM-dependent methyltransferase
VDLKAGRQLLVARWDGIQTHTEHLEYGAAAQQVVEAILGQPYGHWHVETTTETVQLRVTKKGDAQVHRSAAERSQVTAHDRAARTLLAPDDPLFGVLGATADKRRQVDAFLRVLDPALDDLPPVDRPIRVVDLGCGNAALTLATYAHLVRNRGWEAHVTGVDAKAQAREHNTEVAGRLGWATSTSFVQGRIGDAVLDEVPDIVLALHACDTATDEALARAIRWGAPLILAAPCCHHDIQRQLAEAGGVDAAPEPYALLVRHGILRERFADVLTDALRAALLRINGYRVDVVEFVASKHTPRNTLIRAVRTGAPPTADQVADYHALTKAWHLRPALEVLLDDAAH